MGEGKEGRGQEEVAASMLSEAAERSHKNELSLVCRLCGAAPGVPHSSKCHIRAVNANFATVRPDLFKPNGDAITKPATLKDAVALARGSDEPPKGKEGRGQEEVTLAKLIAALRERMTTMQDHERRELYCELFRGYCVHCGRATGTRICRCEDDE